MAPTQTTPTTDGSKEIRTRVKSVIDLDSKAEVSVLKIGQFKPVSNMEEFLARLENDSATILRVVNEGLEEYAKTQLESDAAIPFVTVNEEGESTPAPSNLLIFGSDDKEKQFGASILNMAKMMFGYPDVPRGTKLSADETKTNREKKSTAKQAAIEFVLGNPAAIEALKKA